MKRAAAALAGLTVLAVAALWLLSGGSRLEWLAPVKVVGGETQVGVRASNPHGVRRLKAAFEQDGKRSDLAELNLPAVRLGFLTSNQPPREFRFTVSRKTVPGLKNGRGRLIVEAVSNDFRGKLDRLEAGVEVNLTPPRVTADGAQHYINLGGAELVTFQVGGYWTEAGVRVGQYTFRSFPLPGGGPEDRFSLFAYPWDTPQGTVPVVYARNDAGQEVTARFWHKIFWKKFRSRKIELTQPFLEKVTAEIDPGGGGPLLERFLKINRDLRRRNNQTILDLGRDTVEEFLWSGPFVQLTNSQVEAQFCDFRSYYYEGKKVDEQVHLGFDLAVTARTPVAAANHGRVVYAGRLGIYGNTVVVDHGYGLDSLYAHLSEIVVKKGDAVRKGQIVGRSGATGLAGGDHLHFGMQVQGVTVNPVEWWDGHWIEDRILSKVGGKERKATTPSAAK